MIAVNNAADMIRIWERLLSEDKQPSYVVLNGIPIICTKEQRDAEIERRRDTTDYGAECSKQIDNANKTGL